MRKMGKTYSIYLPDDWPLSMADTAFFLKNVDYMFIALYIMGHVTDYFAAIPKMKDIMDKIHNWRLKTDVALTEKEI